MNNSLVGVAVAGLVGAIVAVAVGASGLVRPPQSRGSSKKVVPATIYIEPSSQGCSIYTIPQTIEAWKNETVEWSIVNRCDSTASNDVEVKFKANDPLDASCAHKGKKWIKCSVNPQTAVGGYRYTVIAGAYSEDPDLEIAP